MKPAVQNIFSRNQSDKSLGSSSMRNKLQTLRERFGNSISKGRSADDTKQQHDETKQQECDYTKLNFATQYDGSYPYWSNDTNLFYYWRSKKNQLILEQLQKQTDGLFLSPNKYEEQLEPGISSTHEAKAITTSNNV